MLVTDQQITDFLSTLDLGVDWIAMAGKKLVAILDANPTAYEEILEASTRPWLTREVLFTIESIGRGQIAPELLILPMHVLNRLCTLPKDEQLKAMQEVEVATPPRNGKGPWTRTSKPACRLTPRESVRAIGPDGLRTADEQEGLLTRHRAPVIGKFKILITDGVPRIEPVSGTSIPDYQKQRVKLIEGCALIELHL